jgi:hypothetical protein
MSELRSAIDSLRGEALRELPDALIEEDFAELHLAVERLEAERLRRLSEIDRRRLYERDGHLSTAAWLTARFKIAWGTAREDVRIARGLEQMPRTRTALESGDVSMSAVRTLAAARAVDPDAFQDAEATLVDAARIHSLGELQRVASFFRQQVEHRRDLRGEDGAWEQRRLHASPTFLGMCGSTVTSTRTTASRS